MTTITKYPSSSLHFLHLEDNTKMQQPLILLHGWGRNLKTLKPLGELLRCDFSVYLLDLPGFGNSPPPENVWSSEDYAQEIKKFLIRHNISSASILGHSFGGKVALSFAHLFPESIDKLILIGASGLKPKRSLYSSMRIHSLSLLNKSLRTLSKWTGMDSLYSKFRARYGSRDYNNAKGIMRSILVKSVNENLSSNIANIHTPSLLIWGQEDQETPMEIAARLHSAMPRSSLITLPHKGHYPFEDAGHHLLARYITHFLLTEK